jgi:hypothetical protein
MLFAPGSPIMLDNDTFKKANIVLERPPRHLRGPEIVDILDTWSLTEMGTGL